MSNLTSEADLAAQFGITEAKAAELRRRHKWPHVRLGRFSIRYTPEQVAAIVALETVKPETSKASGISGQTSRSARRAS
jgi:hypothetical protein